MAEAQANYGGKIIIASRKLSAHGTTSGLKFAFETTHDYSKSRDNNSTSTKSGTLNAPGSLETTLSIDMVSNDSATLKMQQDAIDSGEVMEYWRIFTGIQGSTPGNVKATYMQGTVTSYEESADADDFATATIEVAVNGKPIDGEVTYDVTAAGAQYAFTDLNPYKAVTGISITSTQSTVVVGQQLTVTAQIQPTDAVNKNIVWTTTDDTILSPILGAPAGSKYFTAKKAGTVTVTAQSEDGGQKASKVITVTAS